MAKCVEQLGVEVRYNTFVERLELDGKQRAVRAIHTNQGTLEVDEHTPVVVASGSWAPIMLRQLDYYVPLYPLKGYSLIMDLAPGLASDDKDIPSHIITVGNIYISRFNNQLRIASMGEFSGWDTSPDPELTTNLRLHRQYMK